MNKFPIEEPETGLDLGDRHDDGSQNDQIDNQDTQKTLDSITAPSASSSDAHGIHLADEENQKKLIGVRTCPKYIMIYANLSYNL